jgi:hypothetical protein
LTEPTPIVGQRLKAVVQLNPFEPATVEVWATVPVVDSSPEGYEAAYRQVHEFTKAKLGERFSELYGRKGT